jgi:hypothetical protein
MSRFLTQMKFARMMNLKFLHEFDYGQALLKIRRLKKPSATGKG